MLNSFYYILIVTFNLVIDTKLKYIPINERKLTLMKSEMKTLYNNVTETQINSSLFEPLALDWKNKYK